MATNDVAHRAATGTLSTIVLRIGSFLCTQWVLRQIDAATLGRTAIQLELLHSTCVFLSREGFRLSLTRGSGGEGGRDSSGDAGARSTSATTAAGDLAVWNVAWLTIPVSSFVGVVAGIWHWHITASSLGVSESTFLSGSAEMSNVSVAHDYRLGGMLFVLAACIEGWAEPAVLHALRQLNVPLKASAEALGTFGKTTAAVVFLRYAGNAPVRALGAAQLVYASLYFVVLYYTLHSTLVAPRWRDGLHRPTCYLTVLFTAQGMVKHALTEGDRMVLSAVADSYNQGVYAMGSAYGGLAARLILQPLEENARLWFSRQHAISPSRTSDPARTVVSDPLENTYAGFVKLVLYIGLVFSCLAVHYTSIVLNVLAGATWGTNPEAVSVLTAFCYYTALMAWNGTTEALVYGVATTATELGQLGMFHTIVGIICFAILAPITVTRYGTVGLVAVNGLAMFLRSLYSVYFAVCYFRQRWHPALRSDVVLKRLLGRMIPHGYVLLGFVVSFLITKYSEQWFHDQIQQQKYVSSREFSWWRLAAQHIAIGLCSGVGILILTVRFEPDVQIIRRRLSGFFPFRHRKVD